MGKTKLRLPALILTLLMAFMALMPSMKANANDPEFALETTTAVMNHYDGLVDNHECADLSNDEYVNAYRNAYDQVSEDHWDLQHNVKYPDAPMPIDLDEVQAHVDAYWLASRNIGCNAAYIQLSAVEVTANGELEITVTNLAPGEVVDIVMHSDPVVLAKGKKADANGKLKVKVKIPGDTKPGKHTIKVARADGRTADVATVTVKAPATKGSVSATKGSLPTTGVGSTAPLLVLLTAAGALTLRRNRH